VTAFPDEPLRLVVYRMAETGLTRMPVVLKDIEVDRLDDVMVEAAASARSRSASLRPPRKTVHRHEEFSEDPR
jgi:hypothetical protein